MAAKIIVAYCVLHNKCKIAQLPDIEEDDNEPPTENVQNEILNEPLQTLTDRNAILREGRNQRNEIIQGLRNNS